MSLYGHDYNPFLHEVILYLIGSFLNLYVSWDIQSYHTLRSSCTSGGHTWLCRYATIYISGYSLSNHLCMEVMAGKINDFDFTRRFISVFHGFTKTIINAFYHLMPSSNNSCPKHQRQQTPITIYNIKRHK